MLRNSRVIDLGENMAVPWGHPGGAVFQEELAHASSLSHMVIAMFTRLILSQTKQSIQICKYLPWCAVKRHHTRPPFIAVARCS